MSVKSCISVFLLALMMACNPQALTPDTPSSGADRERVPVSLSLAVAPVDMAETKAGETYHEPEQTMEATENQIRTVTLLQFEWPEGDHPDPRGAVLVGWQYFDHWPLDDATNEHFALVASARKNTIVVVANTDGRVPFVPDDPNDPQGVTTFGNFVDRQNNRLLSEDLWAADVWYRQGDDCYLRMSGSTVLPGVDMNDHFSVDLKRNCAKVVIKLRNTTPGDPGDDSKVIIEDVQLQNINRKYYYLAHFSDALSPEGFAPLTFSDPYEPYNPLRVDGPLVAFPAAANTDGAEQEYVFYLPANERGRNNSNAQYSKNLNAPLGATRFRIYASYGADKPVTYTYYLGEDLVNDFNLRPNHKYTYNIFLTEKGEASSDSRVQDQAEIRFGTDANCYMLQPPVREGKSFTYVLPVRRAAVFWNSVGTNMGVYGACAEDDTVDPLMESTEWTADVLWKEIDNYVSDADFLVGSTEVGGKYVLSGKGFNPDNVAGVSGHQPFIRIKVTAGMKGNAVVALRNSAGVILWSWHVWVTDYMPDTPMGKQDGTFIYAVDGGALHRYNGTTWTGANGRYRDAFIMDRNLGARVAYGTYNDTRGLYYAYGRKDPFRKYGTFTVSGATTISIKMAVHNPTTFYYRGGNWFNTTDKYSLGGTARNAFFDSRLDQHGGDNCEAGKSIYDPCPPGWQVPPTRDFMNGFTFAGDDNRTLAFSNAEPNLGLSYYPAGYANRDATGFIFYPAAGTIWADAARLYWSPDGIYQQTTPHVILHAVNGQIEIYSDKVNLGYNDNSAVGISVRCLRLH